MEVVKRKEKTMNDKPNRRTLRLSSFDYRSKGAYFVTIGTYKRYPHFQDPVLRHILEEQWNKLPQRFPGVVLDSFIIMPDHVHFIVRLEEKEGSVSPSLSEVVGSLKSLTAVEWLRHLKATGSQQSGKIWQGRYYEHIIRNAADLEEKRQYIQNNPLVAQLKKDDERTA
jgi:putative transposase